MPGLVRLKNEDTGVARNAEGYTVKNNDGEKIGTVNTVIVDADSFATRFLVIDVGNLLTKRQYVVRADEISNISDAEKTVYIAGLSKDRLKSGAYEEFDESWWARHNTQHESGAIEATPARFYPPGRGGIVTNQPYEDRMNQGGVPGRSDERVQRTQELMDESTHEGERGLSGSAVYNANSEGPLPDATADDRADLNTDASYRPEGPTPAANDADAITPPPRQQYRGGVSTSASMAGRSARPGSSPLDSPMTAQEIGLSDASSFDAPGSPRHRGLDEQGSSANPDGSDSTINP